MYNLIKVIAYGTSSSSFPEVSKYLFAVQRNFEKGRNFETAYQSS